MNARHDLEDMLRRGLPLDLPAPRIAVPSVGTRLRRSAVLILFGAAAGSGETASELDVLLTRRAAGMRHHAGQIAFPGGGVEPADAGPEGAALRETAEETGIDPAGVDVLGTLSEVHLPVSGNLVTPVVGWWRLPGEPIADAREAVEARRVPVARLLAPEARATWVLDVAGAVHRGPAFRLRPGDDEQVVWGFTAALLDAVFEGAGWSLPWDASTLIRVVP